MKKKYCEPDIKFVRFTVRDIVITSGEPESMSSSVTSGDVDGLRGSLTTE